MSVCLSVCQSVPLSVFTLVLYQHEQSWHHDYFTDYPSEDSIVLSRIEVMEFGHMTAAFVVSVDWLK